MKQFILATLFAAVSSPALPVIYGWADDSPIPVNTPAAQAYNAQLNTIMVTYHNDWSCPGSSTPTDIATCQTAAQTKWRTALNNAGAQYFAIAADTVAIQQARAPLFDTTPNSFTFTALTNVPIYKQQTSNVVIPTGYNVPASISIVGGTFSVNGGPYLQTLQPINPGQTVTVRVDSSRVANTLKCATVDINGVKGQFCVTTTVAAARPVVKRKT